MLFQSPGFLLLFLPLFIFIVVSTPPGYIRASSLLFFSYLFYSGAEPFFLLLLLVSSLTDYTAALRLNAAATLVGRRLWLTVSVLVNLSLLGFFKYGGWVLPAITPTLATLHIPVPAENYFEGFVLPAGISFYTFQSMSYTFDVYRREIQPQRNLLSFCNYVAYLPQLIAGPIERYHHLGPQLVDLNNGKTSLQWSAGLDRVLLGVAQKLLIADSCGRIVDRLVQNGDPGDFVTAWAIAIAFGMQIYYDFAAYTHIAIGISLILGVRLAENFNSPYQAGSIQEFWRRWHMTLSRWFRDYVYIPMGGSRKGTRRTALNVIATFLLVGLWHGAGWNFVAWGLIHGVLLAGYRIKQLLMPDRELAPVLAVALTFVCVHFAWIPFRVDDNAQIIALWSGMLGQGTFNNSGLSMLDLLFIGVVVGLTLLVPNASKRWPGSGGWLESVALAAVALFAIMNTPEISQFIYFQF